MRRFWRAETVFFLALWLGLLATGRSRLFQDPGTFWHTVVGERILSSGRLPSTDTFSFTFHGRPWIASNWLGECLMGVAHQALGWDGLLLGTATLLAALFAWLAQRLLRAGASALPTALLVTVAVAGCAHHFHARTHLATLVGMPLWFAVLCDVEAGRLPLRRLYWLAPACVLWTNLHGGVLAALVMLGLAWAGWTAAWLMGRESPVKDRRGALLTAGAVAACWLAVLINPYGLEMPRTWLTIMGLDLPDLIEEHAPLDFSRPEGVLVLLLGAGYVATLLNVSPRRLRITWLLPLLWLYWSVDRVRHAPLFALVTMVAVAELLPRTRWSGWLARQGWWRPQADEPPATRRALDLRPALAPLSLLAAAIACQAAAVPVPLVGAGWARLDTARWPLDLLPDLRHAQAENPRIGRLFNSLGLGGFVSMHVPEWQVFIDDRCELFGGEFLRDYAVAERSAPERIDRWADEYGIEIALVKSASAFDRYLADCGRWRLVRRTEAAAFYRRIQRKGYRADSEAWREPMRK